MFKKRNVKQQPNLNPSKKSGQLKTTGTNGILNPDIFNRIFGKSSTPQTRRKRSPSPSFFPSAKPSSLFAPQPVTRFTPEDEVVPRPPVCSDSTATAEVHPNRIVGLCSKMCPDSFAEIIMLNCNKIFEIGPDGKPDRELFISNNPRCTSDRNNRPEDVRNEIGLKKTYDRIHDAVISFTGTVPHGQLYQIYYYLKEILTMLVKEVKLTKLYSRLSIDILEFSIRFCT